MLCLIKKVIGSYTFYLVSVLLLFCLFFLPVDNALAVSDHSRTFTIDDGTIPNGENIFLDCYDSSCLSQYSYLSISFSGEVMSNNLSIYGYFETFYFYSSANSVIVFSLPTAHNSNYYFLKTGEYWYFDMIFIDDSGSMTLTLSENSPFGSSSCPDLPSGSISIIENGVFDVTQYSEAIVNVPIPDPEIIQGDYHDDLVSITNGIYICAGTLLVLYFFYCIYRLIIRNSGVK